MRVRILLQRERDVSTEPKQDRREPRRDDLHLVQASAALLTPVALIPFVLGVWRLGADAGFTNSFIFRSGMLSHWQVWLGIAVMVQFLSRFLKRPVRRDAGRRLLSIDALRAKSLDGSSIEGDSPGRGARVLQFPRQANLTERSSGWNRETDPTAPSSATTL